LNNNIQNELNLEKGKNNKLEEENKVLIEEIIKLKR
jgi:hypothetical protein